MKFRLLFIVLPFLFWCCARKSEKSTIGKPDSTQQITYADSGTSSFRFTEKDAIVGQHFRTTETTYKVVDIKTWKNCLVKFHTVTDDAPGMEGQHRSIQFELGTLDNPAKIILKTKHDCDEILFDWEYYKTVKYGCCGSLDQFNYYDYQGKLLVEGAEIQTAYIPNRDSRFYLAFLPDQSKDTTTLGTVQLSYSSSEIYRIKIKSRQPASDEYYPMGVYPRLALRSPNSIDTYDKHQKDYSLWSLEHSKIPWPQQINGFTIHVDFDLDPKLGSLDILLINGKPFGKDDKNQEYWIKNRRKR
ncbi:hypothetical protein [Spirosoma foliorum]|uniref:Uncharacterized protein n=1 Tax=Spirosoma foliorum TaxID=2710596 RepID=A0A7G5GNY4_9BACT|nr:hypothetical protein [Spirosoma foliorum]QMW00576.1 hypothetical protein H3H32_21545 [Spirosoma foliorum]